ncbi:MAG: cysteine desulfurase [Clostridia bacterium]|nr:cysteine desulfurase [Clostridia bacterium]
MIDLDHAATTQPAQEVIDAMVRAMQTAWANPSSPYAAAGDARRELRLARRAIADVLDAEPEEIVFTSGGTEANNLAMATAAGGHAVVSSIEHASVLIAARRWAREVTLVEPRPDGTVLPEDVAKAIRPDTRIISVMMANNETGAIQPVAGIGALARLRRIPFHCDAVQAFGQIPVDVRAMGIDLLSLSGHKIYGPRGVGALYVRQGTQLHPLIVGGGQEHGLRAGTEDVPAIAGLRAAVGLVAADMAPRAGRMRALLDGFIGDVRTRLPKVRLLCADAERLPGLCALMLPGLSAEAAIAQLDLRGIAVSGGAACASAAREVSHVYRALGLSEREARRVIRVSIGRHTTEAELGACAEALEAIEKGAAG